MSVSRLLTFGKTASTKLGSLIDKSMDTPVFSLAGGLIGGIGCIEFNKDDYPNKFQDKMFAGAIGVYGGMCVGYLSAPLILGTLPIMVPVGLYAALSN